MLDVLWFALPSVTAGLIAFGLTPLVARLAVRVGAVDVPNAGKIHTTQVPRLGGLAVVAAIAVAFACARWLSAGRWQLPPHLAVGLGLGILPVVVVSIFDDVVTVPASWKLQAHM